MTIKSYTSIRCRDEGRRAALLDATINTPGLNGIDTVEVEKNNQTTLHVFFILLGVPAGLDDRPELFAVSGGERIVNIRVVDTVKQNDHLDVIVDQAGDFSTYTLSIESAALDPIFAACPFSFKVGCPSPFDCPRESPCVEQPEVDPLIDYYAKDYASFRRGLLDWVSARYPRWIERSEADLGITLQDLLAYTADQLSDYQDRVANEMFLSSARQRSSVKRHSALIDYVLHEGANAHTFLLFTLKSDGLLRFRTPIATQPERGVAPIVFEPDEAFFDPQTHKAPLFLDHNQFDLYTWSNVDCCLPLGATEAYLAGAHLNLQSNHYLLFKEVKSPITKLPADADRARRQVVKLTRVESASDPLTGQALTHVIWSDDDALTKEFCLTTRCADGSTLTGITVACGNLVPASHGESQLQTVSVPPLTPVDETLCKLLPVVPPEPYQFKLDTSPLTFTTETGDPRDGHSTVQIDMPPSGAWGERRTLLESGEFSQDFVVDVDEEGRATIRFGDGVYGRAVPPGATIDVVYRIGNGAAGNVGADTLTQFPAPLSFVGAVTNPLSATGGVDPEPIADVKQLAPQAFHAINLRAVTADDYARATEQVPGVQHASARFRWTGSWHTVFVSVDPIGRTGLSAELKQQVIDLLDAYRMAGYDLEIRPPIYVSLDLAIRICVEPGHFRADVLQALLDVLSARQLPDRSLGFFHPDHFSFADPLYLSRLYQAIETVAGVQSAQVTKFQRWGKLAQGELQRAVITTSDVEIIRCDNDPSEPEHGRLVLTMLGGK